MDTTIWIHLIIIWVIDRCLPFHWLAIRNVRLILILLREVFILESRWKINILRWKRFGHPFRVLVKLHAIRNYLILKLIWTKRMLSWVSRKSICQVTISQIFMESGLIVKVLLIFISPVLVLISSRSILVWWKLLMFFKSWAIPWERIRWRLWSNIWEKLVTLSHLILMVLMLEILRKIHPIKLLPTLNLLLCCALIRWIEIHDNLILMSEKRLCILISSLSLP